jgi:hypothetical protein
VQRLPQFVPKRPQTLPRFGAHVSPVRVRELLLARRRADRIDDVREIDALTLRNGNRDDCLSLPLEPPIVVVSRGVA